MESITTRVIWHDAIGDVSLHGFNNGIINVQQGQT